MEQENLAQDEAFVRRALRESGIVYSLCAVLPVFLSAIVLLIASLAAGETYRDADWYKYLCYLVPQIGAAVSAFLFFRRSKVSVRKTFRVSHWRYFPIAVVLQFGLMFSLSALNIYFIKFLEWFGYRQQASSLPSLEGINLLPAILVIALLPAIFEETIFRGIMTPCMNESGWGTVAVVLISGALFSLFHASPEQTLYQFACGVCYALLALRAGSVFPTMLAHFCNNAAILILVSKGYETTWTMPPPVYAVVCILSAVCLVGTLVYLIFFDKKSNRRGGVKHGKEFALAAAVGIAVCAVEWIFILVSGFLPSEGATSASVLL